MFLTRLGIGSKAIITGDITQVDLKDKSTSGLFHATDILKNVSGIGFVSLNERDVVRHHLVKKLFWHMISESYIISAKRTPIGSFKVC